MRDDFFGVEREKRIHRAGVRKVFTPHTPVNTVRLFFGRKAQVRQLIEQMNTPGQHALLYGHRGVGKSSLANVLGSLLADMGKRSLYRKPCDSQDTFESILRDPLASVGIDVDLTRDTKHETEKKDAGLNAGIAKGGLAHEHSRGEERTYSEVSPSAACQHLQAHRALLVIDEADSLKRKRDKIKLAEFIKLLSDADSAFKVLIVGIADVGDELVGGHKSISRCLKETKLGQMSEDELREIVEGGAKKLKIRFYKSVVDRIVRLSAGYPHFTHLLALKAAEETVADNRKAVTPDDLKQAMASAVSDAESSLQGAYDKATRSYGTDMYRVVLCAAAVFNGQDFSAAQLRQQIELQTGSSIRQAKLNSYLGRLVSDGPDTILRRAHKGVYKFNDPRMPAFIRIRTGIAS